MQTKTAIAIFSMTLGWMGCVASSTGESESATSARLDESTFKPIVATRYQDTRLTTLREQTPAAIPAAIDIQPANGTLFERKNAGSVSVTFTGFALEAGQTIEVQVLKSPNLPIAEENWETLVTGTADTTPTTFGDPTPIFRYSMVATPGANGHWDQGGLLRYRVVGSHASGGKSLLPFYDSVSGDCIQQQNLTSWKDVIKLCKSPFSPSFGDKLGSTVRAAALVSPTPEPGDNLFLPPPYLSRKGFMFPSQTDDYYAIIDAPQTLEEFEFRFGYFDGNEIDATYYNLGDLGIGREMHCTEFNDDRAGASTACYVKNYGVLADGTGAFSGDPDSAMDDATSGQQLNFATVAMVKLGSTFDEPDGNDVQFFVYNATDDLVDEAQLDSVGSNKSIPNNCINCHGGNYDEVTGVLRGSTFLPFDPNSFLYSDVRGFSYGEQAASLKGLNQMIRKAGAPPGTAQFVDGTYANGTEDLDWIPKGWSGSEEAKTVYREVYKPYCRTCHTSQIGDFSFITYDDFKQAAAKTMDDTCTTSQMPVCEATMGLFWRGPARAYLVNALSTSASCTPGTF